MSPKGRPEDELLPLGGTARSAKGAPVSAKTSGPGGRMVTLDVSLLGRDYKVACKPDEQAELEDAVVLLERRMREIRDASKTASVERIAVMAALNLAHDVLRERARPSAPPAAIEPAERIDLSAARRRIAVMRSAIEQVLPGTDKLI